MTPEQTTHVPDHCRSLTVTVGVPERIVASAREQFESFSDTTESNPEFEAFLLEYFEFGWSEEIPPYWELDTAELEHDGN